MAAPNRPYRGRQKCLESLRFKSVRRLSAGKDDETIRLLDLEKGDSRVAAYWTKLLPRAALAKKLHQAVRHARLALAQTKA